ncbi:chemotaxis protein CheB [Lysobacter soyae]|uniref:protein-glutamate methylesterase n=1 Tax=Lysobacter soyae TaxID=2764185 RepID=A0ABX8WRL7_9GAMM|nr:chemotaxis protein CheB [Lysobacter sp. CJ11]QYR53476.1 hypothetical protein H8L67_02930 [Lysobacter sp. CJ11]
MSSADNVVTVLLAAPCDARDALRTALEATKQALVEVDPLTSDAASVLKHSPKNVVVLLDGNTEDALDKFDSVLADPSIRLLFEEASVVTSRQGWDSARWSRHLAAKLIGSDDVLPQGVGDDQGFVAPKPRDAVRKAGAESRDGSAAEDGEPERWPEQTKADADALPEASRMAIDHAEAADLAEAPVDDVSPVIVGAAPEIEEPIVFAPDSLAAFESVPDIEPPAATAAADGQVPGAADASWQMFQAYDVDDVWKPSQDVPSATHLDLDALIASAATAEEEPIAPAKVVATVVPEEVEEEIAPPSEFSFQTGISPAALQSAEALEAPAQPNDLPYESAAIRATDVTAALDAPTSPREWALTDHEDEPEAPTEAKEIAAPAFNIPGSRFSELSLLDDGTDGLEGSEHSESAEHEVTRDGAVFLLGGAGGPDPLRTVLGALPAAFPRPMFIMQHLDAGNYDRLARQMERASNMHVELATPELHIQRGTAYVISPGVNVRKTPTGYAFCEDEGRRGFVDFTDQFPGSDSAIVYLSGADVDWTETGTRFKARGAWLAAQAEIGCFDFAVPSIMISRSAEALDALSIAQKLTARWNTEEQA